MGARHPQNAKAFTLTKMEQRHKSKVIIGNHATKEVPLVQGEFTSYRSQGGLILYTGSCQELNTRSILSSAPPALIFTIVLEGRQKFGYDDLNFDLVAKGSKPKVVAVNLNKPANFRKHLTQDSHFVKLNVIVMREWLDKRIQGEGHLQQFLATHKAYSEFNLSDELAVLANQLISQTEPTSFMANLRLECELQNLAVHLLEQLTFEHQIFATEIDTSSEESLPSHQYHQVEPIISYIEDNISKPVDLAQIASVSAISVSTLQRRFKSQLGMSVTGYIRHRRLEIAKQKLQAGMASITEAAYDAGYQHPSNFTNAFRKTFGQSPSEFVEATRA
ncbi:AraC family transcriptional regulator [Vibrio sp. SCSIO 43136]|uniref:helix-turn-helix transcriptional regulator n=1 Tax=Vibrio sp. SCSIO 43136 TaxID=2819101 RepID=UPI0020764EFA|nr:AraC family transcriptional regulator [Vibrio sp. SCSIO 43136]USD63998.1 helix-turn-helix transcriptional regulator [Vibrio sp. SCSIO 43136]